MNRRRFVGVGLAGLTLGGCALSGDWLDLFDRGADTPPALAAGESALLLRLGDADAMVLMPADAAGPERRWTSSRRDLVLVTRWGRLVRTEGLERDLRAAWFRQIDPLGVAPHHLREAISYLRWIEIEGTEGATSYAVECRLERAGRTTITVLGQDCATVLLREHNRAQGLDWQFENRFWVDAESGTVCQSHQHVVPDLPPCRLQLVEGPFVPAA